MLIEFFTLRRLFSLSKVENLRNERTNFVNSKFSLKKKHKVLKLDAHASEFAASLLLSEFSPSPFAFVDQLYPSLSSTDLLPSFLDVALFQQNRLYTGSS